MDVAKHLERAERHKVVGDALAEAGDEWAAVCYFYAAYHLMRHALRTDPIFDDPTRLAAVSPDLAPELREVARHQGRRGATREYGVNDLVRLLYGNETAKVYGRLHYASIAVRYEDGLRGKPLGQLREELDTIRLAHAQGQLKCQGAAARLEP
ncbi:hypothetical protein [Isoptericola nanjingensis]|uniref:hypothetical protein n=1 Tax=Isoptericola nanjingensis TaxID=903413 RepID=UPI003D21FDA5